MTKPAVARSTLRDARNAFSRGAFSKAAAHYLRYEGTAPLNPADTTKLATALVRSGQAKSGLARLKALPLLAPALRNLVMRDLCRPMLAKEELAPATQAIELLLDADGTDIAALFLAADIFAAAANHRASVEILRELHLLAPQNSKARCALLAAYCRTDQQSAYRFTLSQKRFWRTDQRFAAACLKVLLHGHHLPQGVELARLMVRTPATAASALMVAAETFLNARLLDEAATAGEVALKKGVDTCYAHFVMARLAAQRHDLQGSIRFATRAQQIDPNHLGSAALLARQQLKSGAYGPALAACRNLVRLKPTSLSGRTDLARALTLNRNHGQAADIMLELVKHRDATSSINRLAVSCLVKAGRNPEAMTVFDKFRKQKRRTLPNTLAAGLQAIDQNLHTADFPSARLKWAWRVAGMATPLAKPQNRADWERRARWGHLADRLITDWLECCPDKHDQVLNLFQNYQHPRKKCHQLLSLGAGLVIASAHLGPLYAGPFGLHLMNIPHRWLASTPALSSMAYKQALISTSDLSEIEVGMEFMRSLTNGMAVIVAVDGSINPRAAQDTFEGQRVRYSHFAAKAIHRTGSPSVFATPFWHNRGIEFYLAELPRPALRENRQAFERRWRAAYFAQLRNGLRLGPENLRLSGGIWRDIR